MASPQLQASSNPTLQPKLHGCTKRRRPRYLWWWASIAFFAGGLLWYFTLGSENPGNSEQHQQSDSYSVASLARPIGDSGSAEVG